MPKGTQGFQKGELNPSSSPEGKKRIKKYGFQKGELNPSSNPERKEQIRKEKTGRVLSNKQKKKISRSMKETLKDPALRLKWSKAQIGRKHTKETIEKMIKTKASKPKTITYLKKKADIIFSKYIRYRDSKDLGDYRVGNCITCKKQIRANGQQIGQGGGPSAGHAGHFISRRFNATRYEEKNVHLQCAGCNMWGAGEQYLYSLEIDKRYGKGTAKFLHDKGHEYYKFTKEELQNISLEYKEKYNNLVK